MTPLPQSLPSQHRTEGKLGVKFWDSSFCHLFKIAWPDFVEAWATMETMEAVCEHTDATTRGCVSSEKLQITGGLPIDPSFCSHLPRPSTPRVDDWDRVPVSDSRPSRISMWGDSPMTWYGSCVPRCGAGLPRPCRNGLIGTWILYMIYIYIRIYIWRFLKMRIPHLSSTYRWIFD